MEVESSLSQGLLWDRTSCYPAGGLSGNRTWRSSLGSGSLATCSSEVGSFALFFRENICWMLKALYPRKTKKKKSNLKFKVWTKHSQQCVVVSPPDMRSGSKLQATLRS